MQNISQAQDKKLIMMTTLPVERLVARLAVPSIVTMMISAIYHDPQEDSYLCRWEMNCAN